MNQCVSKLRRMFRVMGFEDEVIATVPKLGFMLRREILVEFRDKDNASFPAFFVVRTILSGSHIGEPLGCLSGLLHFGFRRSLAKFMALRQSGKYPASHPENE